MALRVVGGVTGLAGAAVLGVVRGTALIAGAENGEADGELAAEVSGLASAAGDA